MSQVSIKKNLFYNMSYQVIGMLVPLVSSPYLSRVLGAENLGIHAYTMSIVMYFIMFILLGIGNYGNRTIAKTSRMEPEQVGNTFWEIYSIQFIMALLVITLYTVYVIFFVNEYKLVASVQAILLFANALDITWFFYGKENFKQIVLRNTIIKLAGLIAIFIFVKSDEDLLKYTFLNGSITFLGQLVMWKQLFEEFSYQKRPIESILIHIKPILVLFIPVLAISIFTNISKSLLGSYSDISQVAYFENASKIIEIPKSMIAALGAVMLPRTASLIAEGKEKESQKYIEVTFLYTMFISSALMFGLIAVSNTFSIVFWGETFSYSGELIAVMAPAFVFSVIGNIVRTQFLIPRGRDREYTISLIFGAATNLLVNLLLIPTLGAMGATIATVLAECIMTVIQVCAVRKELRIFEYIRGGSIFFVFGLLMMFGVLFLKSLVSSNTIFTLSIQFLLGGGIYLLLSYIYFLKSKNESLLQIKETFLKKRKK